MKKFSPQTEALLRRRLNDSRPSAIANSAQNRSPPLSHITLPRLCSSKSTDLSRMQCSAVRVSLSFFPFPRSHPRTTLTLAIACIRVCMCVFG